MTEPSEEALEMAKALCVLRRTPYQVAAALQKLMEDRASWESRALDLEAKLSASIKECAAMDALHNQAWTRGEAAEARAELERKRGEAAEARLSELVRRVRERSRRFEASGHVGIEDLLEGLEP